MIFKYKRGHIIRHVSGHKDKIFDFVAVGAERRDIISDYHVAELLDMANHATLLRR